ncbi:MAG TPA: AfsR/SARP family transcriptional regulator [Rugosimonospora sp.]|nr:AfsR/SARP family transcriptional regulator [Rugosimonospora sp.]
MEIRVLGPLLVRCGAALATPTAPKPRSVLALLLLHANQTVPVSALTQELWGHEPPASAHTTLQTYILHLRKVLATALAGTPTGVAKTVLITAPGGYLFQVAPDDFDLNRYQRLASAGRRALAGGDNASAAELLVQAQDQWYGPALADVRTGPLLQPQVQRLTESHLTTVELGIEARLRLGRHQELLPELSGMMAEHRLHENLHAQFMVALHRSGRRQEALRVFQQLRTTMTEELGLEPSKRLHLLQQAILSDDPTLAVAPRTDGMVQLLDQLSLR